VNYGSAAQDNGKVLLAGGSPINGTTAALSSAELYDPSTKTWETTKPMNTMRCDFAIVPLRGGALAIEGKAGVLERGVGALNSVERYDQRTGKWTEVLWIKKPALM
jgi:hypothetical protein